MRECDRYRMTIKDLCEFLQLHGPLRNQIFGGVFGEDAYIGPYAMIEADKVLLVALLRHAHAVTFFENEKAWRSFVEIISQAAAPKRPRKSSGLSPTAWSAWSRGRSSWARPVPR